MFFLVLLPMGVVHVELDQIEEHVENVNRFRVVRYAPRRKIESVDLGNRRWNRCRSQTFVFFLGARGVIGQHFQGHLAFLFRPTNAIVERGVMQSETAVNGERFERFFVALGEMSIAFVHHLHDADDVALDHNWHTEKRLRLVTGFQIDLPGERRSINEKKGKKSSGLPIEPFVAVRIGDVQSFAGRCDVTGDAFVHGKSNTGAFFVQMIVDRDERIVLFASNVEDSGVQLSRSRIDHEQRGSIGIDQFLCVTLQDEDEK